EVLARHVLHHDEEDVLLFFSRDDGDDVGMVQRGQQARLAEKLAEIDALLMRHFQRDSLVGPGGFREIDRPEAAAADCREDLVFPYDLIAEEHPGASIAFTVPVATKARRTRSLIDLRALRVFVARIS